MLLEVNFPPWHGLFMLFVCAGLVCGCLSEAASRKQNALQSDCSNKVIYPWIKPNFRKWSKHTVFSSECRIPLQTNTYPTPKTFFMFLFRVFWFVWLYVKSNQKAANQNDKYVWKHPVAQQRAVKGLVVMPRMWYNEPNYTFLDFPIK